jgi:radical SAM superfamily enzyme YgiQ (UPF0313 family)
VRWRSVENLIEELEAVKAQYRMRFVGFQDDIFGLNGDWLEKFCSLYRQEIKLPFSCSLRADLVTGQMSQMLSNAGCVHVAIGLEAGNDHIRNAVLKKNISREQIIAACHTLQTHGIAITTHNIFGLPFETIDTALETIELNVACQPERAHLYFYVPYPHTRLAQIAIDEGFFKAEDLESLPEQFVPKHTSLTLDLENGRQIGQLAWLIHVCVRFPALYPPIRSLFKRQGSNWLKSIVSATFRFARKIYLRITSKSRSIPARKEPPDA